MKRGWPKYLLNNTIIFDVFKHFLNPRCSLQRDSSKNSNNFMDTKEKLKSFASKSGPHLKSIHEKTKVKKSRATVSVMRPQWALALPWCYLSVVYDTARQGTVVSMMLGPEEEGNY
jgi:hypothetical protein